MWASKDCVSSSVLLALVVGIPLGCSYSVDQKDVYIMAKSQVVASGNRGHLVVFGQCVANGNMMQTPMVIAAADQDVSVEFSYKENNQYEVRYYRRKVASGMVSVPSAEVVFYDAATGKTSVLANKWDIEVLENKDELAKFITDLMAKTSGDTKLDSP